MCGASDEQKLIAANLEKFSQTMQSNFADIFAGNEEILKNITGALTPIVQAGEGQFGLTPAAEAAERTQSMEQSAAAGTNVSNAVNESLAAKGGGNTFMPAGSIGAIEEQIASDTARQNAQQQLGITEQGYNMGRENFFKATSELAGAPAALENPEIGFANSTLNAGEGAMGGANAVQAANMAPWQELGGVIGGVGGAALGNPSLFGQKGRGGGGGSGGSI